MSFQASEWVRHLNELPAPARAVMYLLASYADEAGTCYPGQERIAQETSLSESTVRRALRALEDGGYLRREERRTSGGYRTSDRYHLQVGFRPPQGATGQSDRVTVREPLEEQPDVSAADAAAQRPEPEPDAQTIVGAWIEACPQRPPSRVIGHLSREVKALLDEGHPHPEVLAAVQAWHVKGLHPAALPSVLHEIRHRRPAREVAAAQQAAAMAARTPWTPPAPGTVRRQPHTPPMIGA